MDFFDGAEKGLCGFGGGGGCSEDWFEFFFGFENVVYCETPAIVFQFSGVDVYECEDILDGPAFAVLVFGDEVRDFDSCARVEVFAEDAADSTADAAAYDGGFWSGCGCGCSGEAWVSRLGEDFDIPDEHIHVRENTHTVVDGVECFGLGCWGGGENNGGGECKEC